jgi:hypothetical protein
MKALASWVVVSILTFGSIGCGSADDPVEEPSGEALAALCAGAAQPNGDGTATQSGCVFEQQLINVSRYGHTLEAQTLLDADGHVLATVDGACGSWYVGTDPAGVRVSIDQKTGAIRSHGALHPGNATSSLPASAPIPLLLE